MEKLGQFLDIGSTVPEKLQSTLLTQPKIMHANIIAVSSYCVSTGLHLAATGIAFLPKTNVTEACYAGCSARAAFTRTLRNQCKSRGGGYWVAN